MYKSKKIGLFLEKDIWPPASEGVLFCQNVLQLLSKILDVGKIRVFGLN